MVIPESKSQVIGNEQSSDNEAQLVTHEYIKRSSLSSPRQCMANRISAKWYRSTFYNALILGICNFLAPGSTVSPILNFAFLSDFASCKSRMCYNGLAFRPKRCLGTVESAWLQFSNLLE
jgi:hypothetical protein